MANADAQFTFETNITQVSAEIQRELRRIANLSESSTGPGAGEFVRDVAGVIQKNTAAAYRELRQLKAQYDEINKSGRGLRPGEASLSQESQRVLTNLNAANQAALRQKAAAAGPELAGLDLAALYREIDKAIVSRARNGARAVIREAEKAGDGAGIYGTQKDIPTGVPKTNLSTVGDLQGALQAEAKAVADATAAAQDKAKADREAAAAERRRQAAADKDDADRRAGKILPPVGEVEKQVSAQVKAGIASNDPQYGFVSQTGRPSKQVFFGDDPETVRIFQQVKGEYTEIARDAAEFAVAQRTVRDILEKRASDERARAAQQAADEDALEKALQAYARSLEIKAKVAARDPEVQFLNDRGRPTSTVAVGSDPDTAEFFKASKGHYVQLEQGDIEFTNAQRLLGDVLKDRTTVERRAAEASNKLADRLRQQAAELQAAPGGGGGFGGAFLKGALSGGFGGEGGEGLNGLARAAGTTVKYDLLYKTLNGLLGLLGQVSSEFLNVDDSITELNIAMGDGTEVSTEFINRLQDVAAPGGFNVGDAMDQAAASIRAYGEEAVTATLKSEGLTDTLANRQQVIEDQGTAFAKAAAQIAVLAKTTLPDAAQNTRATAIGFGLDPNTAGQRIADAIAGAKKIGGGLEKDISQGGANIAEVAKAAGFSLEESLGIISKISAATDESGTLAATRVSRLVGTLQGSGGKNFLTQLNQGLAPDKKIDISASPRDQLLQIAAAYSSLNEAQKQQLATAIGGQAQQREFNVLLGSFPEIADKAKQGFVGLANKQYAEALDNVRGQLTQIIGALRGIVTNVAQSGLAEPAIALLAVIKPVLEGIRAITAAFNLIPAPLREIGGLLLAIFGTMKLIEKVQLAGGVTALLSGAERAVRPEAALARQQLSFGAADTKRATTLSQIATDESTGALTAGQASKARLAAEQDYRAEITRAAADHKRAMKASATAVEEGGKDFRDKFSRLRGDQIGKNIEDLRGALSKGTTVGQALTATVGGVRSGGRAVALALGQAAATIRAEGVVGAAGGALSATKGALTAERELSSFGRVGGAVASVGRGVGSLVASELGPIGIGLIAADFGLQLKTAFDSIGAAQREADAAAGAEIKAGADGIHDAALANGEAAQKLRDASGGFFGSIANALQGGQPGQAADAAQRRADSEAQIVSRVEALRAAARTGTGPEALAAQIDTSSADNLKTSVKNLQEAGYSSAEVLTALSTAMKSLKFVTSNKLTDLTDSQRTELGGRIGLEAQKALEERKTALEAQQAADQHAHDNALTPTDRNATQQRVDADQANLDQLNFGGIAIAPTLTTNALNKFSKDHPGANIVGDPKIQQAFIKYLTDLFVRVGKLDPASAALAASRAVANLPISAEQFKANLSDPTIVAAFVGQRLDAANAVGADAANAAQLAALRTGQPDRSATAGLAASRRKLVDLKTELDGDLADAEASSQDTSALHREITKVQIALDENQIKQLQQAAADAKDDISHLEKRRRALQAAASTAAQVQAIGDSSIKAELDKAVPTHDADLIASVMELASKRELQAYQTQLENNLAADNTSVENERKREIALGLLDAAGNANAPRPSPLAPGTPDPQNLLPDFLKPKGKLPKALQDLLDKAKADQATVDQFKRLFGESNPTGTAETGADAPGGTPAEKAAAQAAAAAEKGRDSLAADRAAVAAARAALAKTTAGTREFYAAQQQLYAAQNKLADDQRSAALANAEASLFPGDKVGQAKAALTAARANLGVYARGTKEYGDALKALNAAQYAYTQAVQEAYFVHLKANTDLSDPLAQAALALRQAKAKLVKDKAAGADQQTLDNDRIDANQKANDQEAAIHSRTVQHAQDLEAAGRISHAQLLRVYQGEQARILERLRLMKKGQNGYQQLQDELLDIQKDIKAANTQLQGQFNLGDIKVPTVYEVRRAIASQQSAVSAIANSTVNNNTTITISGVDTDKIMAEISKHLGGLKAGLLTTKPRKA